MSSRTIKFICSQVNAVNILLVFKLTYLGKMVKMVKKIKKFIRHSLWQGLSDFFFFFLKSDISAWFSGACNDSVLYPSKNKQILSEKPTVLFFNKSATA